MIAHIITVVIGGHQWFKVDTRRKFSGEVTAKLRSQFESGSTTANWIDTMCHGIAGDTALVQVNCPNNVGADRILTAVNQAVKALLPHLTNDQWEAIMVTSIYCMNQDR